MYARVFFFYFVFRRADLLFKAKKVKTGAKTSHIFSRIGVWTTGGRTVISDTTYVCTFIYGNDRTCPTAHALSRRTYSYVQTGDIPKQLFRIQGYLEHQNVDRFFTIKVPRERSRYNDWLWAGRGRAIAQEVSRWLPTEAARVQNRV
jgi:hypothetical protein